MRVYHTGYTKLTSAVKSGLVFLLPAPLFLLMDSSASTVAVQMILLERQGKSGTCIMHVSRFRIMCVSRIVYRVSCVYHASCIVCITSCIPCITCVSDVSYVSSIYHACITRVSHLQEEPSMNSQSRYPRAGTPAPPGCLAQREVMAAALSGKSKRVLDRSSLVQEYMDIDHSGLPKLKRRKNGIFTYEQEAVAIDMLKEGNACITHVSLCITHVSLCIIQRVVYHESCITSRVSGGMYRTCIAVYHTTSRVS
jgi:hypothetical protein